MRKKLSGPGKWTISHKHVLFVCFFLSLSAALTDLIKKPLPTLAHLAFSMPCGHCLHFYHYFAKNTTATVLWWTTKQCLAIWISQLGLCKQLQEGKQLPVLGVFHSVLIKKPFAQEARCCFFSRLSLTADWKHEPLSNMEMDSGKYVAGSSFAVLRGNISKRSDLSHLYILLFSITVFIFLKLSAKCSPAHHLPSKQDFQKSSSAI